jgi:hypothetical protein
LIEDAVIEAGHALARLHQLLYDEEDQHDGADDEEDGTKVFTHDTL